MSSGLPSSHVSCLRAACRAHCLHPKHVSHPLHLSKLYLCSQDTCQRFGMSNHRVIFQNINQIYSFSCLKALLVLIALSAHPRALYSPCLPCPAPQPALLSLSWGPLLSLWERLPQFSMWPALSEQPRLSFNLTRSWGALLSLLGSHPAEASTWHCGVLYGSRSQR